MRGFAQKKWNGRMTKSCHITGMTDQSSSRGTWWKPNVYQATISVFSMLRFRLDQEKSQHRKHRYRCLVYVGLPPCAPRRGLVGHAGDVARFRHPAIPLFLRKTPHWICLRNPEQGRLLFKDCI